jgi:predicted nucleic acid-binding Zn ribbon protein
VFKGSGFYVTDSRKRSWSDGDSGSNGASASEESKDTTAAAAG